MRFRKLKDENHGALAYFAVFVFIVFTLLTLFAVFTPLSIDMNVQFFKVGEELINDSQAEVEGIQDVDIREAISDSLDEAKSSTSEQVSILSGFFQYAWIFIIIVVAFVILVIARSNVETRSIR